LFGIFTDDLLRNPDEEIDPARHFHRRRGHNNREDDEKHFTGDVRRRDIKTNDEHQQPHCPHNSSPTPPMRAPIARALATTQKLED